MSKKNKDNKTKTKSNNFDCHCNDVNLDTDMSCDCHKDNCHCTKKNSTNNFEEKGEQGYLLFFYFIVLVYNYSSSFNLSNKELYSLVISSNLSLVLASYLVVILGVVLDFLTKAKPSSYNTLTPSIVRQL